MIRRVNRFHGLGSLGFLLRRGKTVRTPELSLRYILNSRQTDYRLSIAVSRKVSKSAVVRNRIRRRIYEVIRNGSPIRKPYDLLFIAHTDKLSEMPIADLASRIQALLQKAEVLEGGLYSANNPARDIVISKEK